MPLTSEVIVYILTPLPSAKKWLTYSSHFKVQNVPHSRQAQLPWIPELDHSLTILLSNWRVWITLRGVLRPWIFIQMLRISAPRTFDLPTPNNPPF